MKNHALIASNLFLAAYSVVALPKEPIIDDSLSFVSRDDITTVEDYVNDVKSLHLNTICINDDYVSILHNGKLKFCYLDMPTLRILDSEHDYDRFFIDKNGVYLFGELITSDTTNFRIVEDLRVTDSPTWRIGEHVVVWSSGDKVFFEDTELKGIDARSFESCGSNSFYFKDKNRLYYIDKQRNVKPIENVDLETLSILYKDMCYDKDHLYFKDQIATYEGKVVKPINDYMCVASKKVLSPHNFYHYSKIDAATLKPISDDIAMDKRGIYLRDDKLPVKRSALSKTKIYKWWGSCFLSDGKTIRFVYFIWGNLEYVVDCGFDAETFGIAKDHYIFDKNGIYEPSRDEFGRLYFPEIPFDYIMPFSIEDVFFINPRYTYYNNQVFGSAQKEGRVKFAMTLEQAQKLTVSNLELVELEGAVYPKKSFEYNNLYEINGKIYCNDELAEVDHASFKKHNGLL